MEPQVQQTRNNRDYYCVSQPYSRDPKTGFMCRFKSWAGPEESGKGYGDDHQVDGDEKPANVTGARPDTRFRAFYPEIRITTSTYAQTDSRLSFGHVAGPGTYSTTVTRPDLFEGYLEQQIALLIENHAEPVVIARLRLLRPNELITRWRVCSIIRRRARSIFRTTCCSPTINSMSKNLRVMHARCWRTQTADIRRSSERLRRLIIETGNYGISLGRCSGCLNPVRSGLIWKVRRLLQTGSGFGKEPGKLGRTRRTTMATKPMTKTQLVAALSEEMGTDKKSASAALDAIVGLITKEVSGGGAVTLPGVGKIYCRERPERMVRNPATGEQIKKDADKVVKMTIAKALKDSVNG
ncbi:DNA-binding protein HU-beta 2 [Nymphon striatum]|nr:DNA-binding protein HU-beta 2 [Nymphon striatum]